MEVPMLDEIEYKEAHRLYGIGFRNDQIPLSKPVERFSKLISYYREVSGGWEETVPNSIMHHRISSFGPACHSCGKPYRTPVAAFCAACGHSDMG